MNDGCMCQKIKAKISIKCPKARMLELTLFVVVIYIERRLNNKGPVYE